MPSLRADSPDVEALNRRGADARRAPSRCRSQVWYGPRQPKVVDAERGMKDTEHQAPEPSYAEEYSEDSLWKKVAAFPIWRATLGRAVPR